MRSDIQTSRVEQLKRRLQALTADYSAFFAGFPAALEIGPKRKGRRTAMLTDLQQLRRVQLAFIAAEPPRFDGDTGPILP